MVNSTRPSRLRDRAVEAAANAFVISDIAAPDQPVVEVNPAFERITGYSPAEVVGRNCRFLQGSGTDPAMVAQIRDAIGQRSEITVTLLNYRRDGMPFWNEVFLRPIPADDGAVTHYVGVQNDVTARVRMAELEAVLAAEREAGRLKDAFLATMSHELRTPLTAISGYTELLGMGSLDAAQMADLSHIAHGADHLLGLIDDVLRWTELEAGRQTMDRQPIALAAAVTAVLARVEPQATAKGLALDAAIPAGLDVWADAVALDRILGALVSNAVKFTDAGSVRIVGQEVDDRVEVAVTDTGIGIGIKNVLQLFSPFRQGDDSRTRRHGGTGLGLALAKRLAELHRGTIAVVSEPGVGSTFTLWLPGPAVDRRS